MLARALQAFNMAPHIARASKRRSSERLVLNVRSKAIGAEKVPIPNPSEALTHCEKLSNFHVRIDTKIDQATATNTVGKHANAVGDSGHDLMCVTIRLRLSKVSC